MGENQSSRNYSLQGSKCHCQKIKCEQALEEGCTQNSRHECGSGGILGKQMGQRRRQVAQQRPKPNPGGSSEGPHRGAKVTQDIPASVREGGLSPPPLQCRPHRTRGGGC